MISEEGRTIVVATVAAISVLLQLWAHPMREAREFAITMMALLAFLIFAVLQTEANIQIHKCPQPGLKSPTTILSRATVLPRSRSM
jgi:hypothetical protein